MTTRKEKKKPAGQHLPALGNQAKGRHDKFARAQQHDPRIWQRLDALKEPPKIKHRSYFEAVENPEKKKKLEYEVTTDRNPPPGFEFVPTGHPELTTACKELSRDQDAMIFIVSDSKDVKHLEHHMHRSGYHFRQTIVEQARKQLWDQGIQDWTKLALFGQSEGIPQSQDEINRQADAVLRDLFPRIPNTDRYEIIRHAFQKDGKFKGEIRVGMATELSLARRVQLAALAHIRHTHTRYDELLKETDWANARKAVEQPCLDTIVKWRGDEETGRDQLDEILREVIEISDSEGSDDEATSSEEKRAKRPGGATLPTADQDLARRAEPASGNEQGPGTIAIGPLDPRQQKRSRFEKRQARRAERRFRRYAAAAEAITNGERDVPTPSMPAATANRAVSQDDQGPRYGEQGTQPHTTQVPHLPQPAHSSGGPISESTRHPVPYAERPVSNQTPASMQLGEPVRGQSPRLIRVGESSRPKVGLPLDHRNHSDLRMSPVRYRLEDMLVPSIEPISPSARTDLQRSSHFQPLPPQHGYEAPRVISRTIVHEPVAFAPRPASPIPVSRTDGGFSDRRYVPTTYYPEDYEPPAVEFINLRHADRDHGSQVTTYDIPPDRWTGQPNYGPQSRMRSRSRSPVPYIGTSDRPYRDGVAYRTRTDPILIDTPPRLVQRAPMGVGNVPPRRVEVMHQAPMPELYHLSEQPQVVYLESSPRIGAPHRYRDEPPNVVYHRVAPMRETRSMVQPRGPQIYEGRTRPVEHVSHMDHGYYRYPEVTSRPSEVPATITRGRPMNRDVYESPRKTPCYNGPLQRPRLVPGVGPDCSLPY